jgi:hypothetical protein
VTSTYVRDQGPRAAAYATRALEPGRVDIRLAGLVRYSRN